MDEEQDVRLEFEASVEIDARRVVRFVQELKEVPPEAWCEVENVSSKRQTDSKGRMMESVATTAQMRCEPRVANFLCQHFSKQVRHVSQGELFMVRCRRVFVRTLPMASPPKRSQPNKALKLQQHASAGSDTIHRERTDEKRSPALSRSTMIDLLDCLGDRIVDVLDAFQAHAVQSDRTALLTMIGLVQALAQLSKREWAANPDPRPMSVPTKAKKDRKDDSKATIDRLAVQQVRHLLMQLIGHDVISLTSPPDTNDTPFLSYTDFIACYVASMSNDTSLHAPPLVAWEALASLTPSGGESHNQSQAMVDTFGFSMEASTASSSVTSKQPRKQRRSHRPIEPTGPETGDVFLGVAEMAPTDDGIESQRSECDERTSGKSTGQSHRSRGSKSNRATSKTQQASVSTKDAVVGIQPLGGEELSLRESTTLARQQLTSSASRVRPSKQQQQQPPPQHQPLARSLRPTTRQVNQMQALHRDFSTASGKSVASGNNNDEEEEPVVEEEGTVAPRRGIRGGPATHHQRGTAEWEILHGVNQAGQLPSRSHRYLNLSAGSDGLADEFPPPQQDEEDSPLSEVHDDRPPSRQRHAFPTHLLDARDFFSPAKQHEGVAAISITPWHADEDDEECLSAENSSPEEETGDTKHSKGDARQRPPSRYMTKAPRGDTSSSSSSSTVSEEPQVSSSSGVRLPSRRGAPGLWNQAAQYHHDPKTDGFADLDERVPPPFRVEITTESARSQYVPSDHRRADEERRHSLKSRRASSFGTRTQLNKLQQAQAIYGIIDQEAGLRGRGSSKRASSTRQSKVPTEPEWLGQDRYPAAGLSVDVPRPPVIHHSSRNARDANPIDNSSTNSSSGNATNPSASAHQWFRASNNPFFLTPAAPPVASEFDEMDADTAIANTPLFAGEGDLMAMTQLSDLHLDDFMGDPYVLAAPPACAPTGMGVSRTSTDTNAAMTPEPGSKKLNTSLGKDFLSLFAQH